MSTRLFTRAWRPLVAGAGVLTIAAALTLTTGGIANAATGPTCVEGTCTISFALTGAPETWTVPTGVTSVTATVVGGAGGAVDFAGSNYATTPAVAGGTGGGLTAAVPVTPGQTITAVVGGKGQDGISNTIGTASGGYGGGGKSGQYSAAANHGGGGAGGGGSFLFEGSTLEVAAGGGGGTAALGGQAAVGGAGGSGGDAGAAGNAGGALGSGGSATTTAPGAGGSSVGHGAPPLVDGSAGSVAPSTLATLATGGAGAVNSSASAGPFVTSGGGGGGYYAGGGGAIDGPGGFAGAGGGGSGFVAPAVTGVTALLGNTGDGSIVITYSAPAVVKTVTTTTVTASSNPVAGTPTTLTARVTPTPADGGLVTIKVDGTSIYDGFVSDGVLTFDAVLNAGQHSITAVYSGDNTSAPSTSPVLNVTVAAPGPVQTAPVFGTASSSTTPVNEIATAGQAFSLTGLGATGTPTPTYTVADDDGDGVALPDGVTFDNGTLTGSTESTGTWQFTVTATNAAGTATEHVLLTVNAGPAVGLETIVVPGDGTANIDHAWEVAPDGSVTEETQTATIKNATITAKQGDQVSFVTTPVDQYGNSVDETDPAAPVAKSSIKSDKFTYSATSRLTTILFTHASAHVISYTADGLTGTFTVQVAPVTTPTSTPPPTVAGTTTALAYTGSNPTPALGLAGLLLALGVALRAATVIRRRRNA